MTAIASDQSGNDRPAQLRRTDLFRWALSTGDTHAARIRILPPSSWNVHFGAPAPVKIPLQYFEGRLNIGGTMPLQPPSKPVDIQIQTTAAVDPNDIEPLKFDAAVVFADHLKITLSEVQKLMRLSDRMWQRRRQRGVFDAEESDRLYRLARVARKAIDVFGSEDRARSWLTKPNRVFDRRTPLSLLTSDQGATLVTDELNRVDFGDLF